MDPKTKEKFTFGGGRFQFDPVDLFPGKTEQEIVDLKKTYFIGDKLKKDFFSDGKFTGTAEDFENIKNLTIFDQNRKATLENVQQNKKKLTEDFISKKSLDDLVLDNMKNVASGKGSQAGFMRADVPLELVKGAGRLGLRALDPLGTVAGTVRVEGALAAGRPIEETLKDPLTGLALVLPEAGKNVVRNARLANLLNLGMKASTLARMTPIGLGITGLQLGYGLYEKGQEQKAMMDAMTPYQRELYESQLEGEAFEGEAAGFKKGGRVDKKSKKDLPGQPDPTLPIDPSRRDFLEKTGGGIAGLAALGMGAFKISKVAPKVKETIMNFPSDAPNWLLPLYNKIKSLGTESSVKATYKTPDYTVTDLKTEDGNYKITENQGTGEIVISADTDAGINYSPVDFIITPNKVDMVESRAVGRMTGPDDYDIDLEEYVTNDLDDLGSDWHALEEFATGKTNKEAQVKKQTTKSYIEENPGEDISSRQGEMPDYDPEDYYD